MIIQRIAKGIKDQDWFVVSVEIMIVVIGIFIGLQVDDWNQERKNRELELYYFEQFAVELEETIQALKQESDYALRVSSNALSVEKMLADQSLSDATMPEFYEHAYRSFFSSNSRVFKVYLNQLTSDKGAEIVQSREMRRLLGQYLETIDARLAWETEWLRIIRAELVKIHHGIGWRGTNRPLARPINDILSDQNLVGSYAFISSTQAQIARNQTQLRIKAEELLTKVKLELAHLQQAKSINVE